MFRDDIRVDHSFPSGQVLWAHGNFSPCRSSAPHRLISASPIAEASVHHHASRAPHVECIRDAHALLSSPLVTPECARVVELDKPVSPQRYIRLVSQNLPLVLFSQLRGPDQRTPYLPSVLLCGAGYL